MKLRSKLILALLSVSLLGAGLVGGVAYWMLMRDFDQAVEERAFEHFQSDVADYVRLYGSWEAGRRQEPFPWFVQRTRRGPPAPGQGMPPPPPLRAGGVPRAPFHFVLLDPDWRVLKGGGPFVEGEPAPASARSGARPITVDGQLVAFALPYGRPNLSPQDERYLAAVRQSLLTGFLVAGTLAALLGLLFGRRLSLALNELAGGVRAMTAEGELPQPLPVRSRDELGELAAAFNRMSAELASAHGELRELSVRDPLTQLYNRRHFDEQAAQLHRQALRYGQPLSVMVGDLDHFKRINDEFSHAVGDEVLRRVAHILRTNTRASDIVARFGGEEFVVAFAQTTPAQAARHCEELRRLIETQPWHEVAAGLRVTMSMGLNGDPALGSIEKMLNAADTRLYAAKDGGRNRVVFEPVPC